MDKIYITYILRMEANEVLAEQIIETIIQPIILTHYTKMKLKEIFDTLSKHLETTD